MEQRKQKSVHELSSHLWRGQFSTPIPCRERSSSHTGWCPRRLEPPSSVASALRAQASAEHLSHWYSCAAVDKSLPTRVWLCMRANTPSDVQGASAVVRIEMALLLWGQARWWGETRAPCLTAGMSPSRPLVTNSAPWASPRRSAVPWGSRHSTYPCGWCKDAESSLSRDCQDKSRSIKIKGLVFGAPIS